MVSLLQIVTDQMMGDSFRDSLNTVVSPGSSLHTNFMHIWDSEEGNVPRQSEWHLLMGYFAGRRGWRNLAQAPKMRRVGYRQGKLHERTGRGTMGGELRWTNRVVYYLPGGSPPTTKDHQIEASNEDYAYLKITFGLLGQSPGKFKQNFVPMAGRREPREAEKTLTLEQLLEKGRDALSPEAIEELEELIASGSERKRKAAIMELLKLADSLLHDDQDTLRYRANPGNLINRLYTMLHRDFQRGRLEASDTYVSVYKIVNGLEPSTADWVKAWGGIKQFVKENTRGFFGREREDLAYAREHGKKLGFRSIPGQKQVFFPAYYCRESRKPKRAYVFETLAKPTITRAEAEGIRERYKSFWKERDGFLRERLKEYFPGELLQQAADGMWAQFNGEDREEIHEALKERTEPEAFFSRKERSNLKRFYHVTDYALTEAEGAKRERQIGDTFVRLYSIKDALKLMPELKRLWAKYQLWKGAPDELKEEIRLSDYRLVSEGEKETLERKLAKLKGSYVPPDKELTQSEREALRASGITRGRFGDFISSEVPKIEAALKYNLLHRAYCGKGLASSAFAKAYGFVGENLRRSKGLSSELQFIQRLAALSFDASRFDTDTKSAKGKNEPDFRLDLVIGAEFLSRQQREAIKAIYETLIGFEGISRLKKSPDSISRLAETVQTMQELQERNKYYTLIPGQGLVPVSVRLLDLREPQKNPNFLRKNGISILNPASVERADSARKDYAKADDKFTEKLELLSRDTVQSYLNKAGTSFFINAQVGVLAERIRRDRHTAYVHRNLAELVGTYYGNAMERVNAAQRQRESTGYDVEGIANRLAHAIEYARVMPDGRARAFAYPPGLYQKTGMWEDFLPVTQLRQLEDPTREIAKERLKFLDDLLREYEKLKEFKWRQAIASASRQYLGKDAGETFEFWINSVHSGGPNEQEREQKDVLARPGEGVGGNLGCTWTRENGWHNPGAAYSTIVKADEELTRWNKKGYHFELVVKPKAKTPRQ